MSNSVKVKTYKNYVNGKWSVSQSSELLESINPANKNEIVGYAQQSTTDDLNEAITFAKSAQRSWRNLSGGARGDLLFKTADIMESRLADIAETMTREMGKTLMEARGETARGIAILRYYAGEGLRKIGDVIPSTDNSALMYTTRVPLGIVGVITPWNFPVAIPIWKIAPALVYGNSVVLKPAQEAVITAIKVIECFNDAGFPAGVINCITGKGSVIGKGLSEHPDINAITFTGSNTVGKAVGKAAFDRGAKYQLEMGGKNPIIIASDANLDLAVEGTISGGLRSTGQKCTATSKVVIMREVYDTFKEKLLKKVAALKVGNGMEQDTWMGPCVSEIQLEKVLTYVEKGKKEGGKLLYGGQKLTAPEFKDGFYVSPTLFDQVTPAMSIAREEIFGPILVLIPVDSMEEAIEIANDTEFGLSASIYTRDIGSVLSFIQDIDAGLVRVNSETAGVELQAPFGGMKQSSSHSREQGQAAIEFFTSIKTVFVKP